MQLILPDGNKVFLDTKLPYADRVNVVTSITQEWGEHFRNNWYMNKTKITLDILSTYLVVIKEEINKHKEDKYVLSSTKVRKMKRGDSRQTNFSELSLEDKQLMGFDEPLESDYR